jgi:hypothetical protein
MAAHARHARDGAPGDGLAVDTHGAIIGGVACTIAFALMVRPKLGAAAIALSQLTACDIIQAKRFTAEGATAE